MYAAVSDISYIEEGVASWEKESDSVAKLWASNIRFGYCAILTVRKKARNNKVCLHVSTYCYKTQHNQKLHTPPGVGIRLTMSEAMTRSMHCPSIMICTRVVIVEAPS